MKEPVGSIAGPLKASSAAPVSPCRCPVRPHAADFGGFRTQGSEKQEHPRDVSEDVIFCHIEGMVSPAVWNGRMRENPDMAAGRDHDQGKCLYGTKNNRNECAAFFYSFITFALLMISH